MQVDLILIQNLIRNICVLVLSSTPDYNSSLSSANESPKSKHQNTITKFMDKVTSKKEEKIPKTK
jgi:hypothetical protein